MLNDRIDAVEPDAAAASSTHERVRRVVPRAAARARPRRTDYGDYEPLQFDTKYWRDRLLSPTYTDPPPDTHPP